MLGGLVIHLVEIIPHESQRNINQIIHFVASYETSIIVNFLLDALRNISYEEKHIGAMFQNE